MSKATIMEEALKEYVVAEIIKSNINLENKKYFVLPISEPCPVTKNTLKTLLDDDFVVTNEDLLRRNVKKELKHKWLSHLPFGGVDGSSYVKNNMSRVNMLIW